MQTVRIEFSENQQVFHVVDFGKRFIIADDWKIVCTCNDLIANDFTSKMYNIMNKRKLSYYEVQKQWNNYFCN